jgi:hypothetical protein
MRSVAASRVEALAPNVHHLRFSSAKSFRTPMICLRRPSGLPLSLPSGTAVNRQPAWERREELAMPSASSTPSARPANLTTSHPRRLLAEDARAVATTKRTATLRRLKAERRSDKLDEIRAQIADGTLVVRQMTSAEHSEAARVARRTLAGNQARRKFNAPAPRRGSTVGIG